MADSDTSELECPKKGGCKNKKSKCAKKSGCGGSSGPSVEKVVTDALDGFVKKHEEIEEKRENAGRTASKIEEVE
jgi:hypothetical protein